MDETTFLTLAAGTVMLLFSRAHGAVVRKHGRHCRSCGVRQTLGIRCRCRRGGR